MGDMWLIIQMLAGLLFLIEGSHWYVRGWLNYGMTLGAIGLFIIACTLAIIVI